jgi:N-acetylglutamate synthase
VPDPADHQHPGEPGHAGPDSSAQHGLGPHVVGQRVVVRRLVRGERGPSGGPAMTDVLGMCAAWGEGRCVVVREDGTAVAIALADIVSGKPVPPRPSVRHRLSAREVEGHVLSLWDEVHVEPLGEWQLRTSGLIGGRHPRRANSTLAMGDPGMPAGQASDAILAWYADRGRPPQAQVVDRSQEHDALLALGWKPLGSGSAHCQLASVAQALRQLPHADAVELVESGERVEAALPGARGRAALDGDWVGVHSVVVEPHARRQGLARTVLAGLLDWAASRGATTAWLHVEIDNAAAIALYEQIGFRTHHSLVYLGHPD